MSIEMQCMTEKLIVITIKLDYSKVPSKSTVPTYVSRSCICVPVRNTVEDKKNFITDFTTYSFFVFKYISNRYANA